MRDGMPLAYLLFRTAWSVVHMVLLAVGFALLAWWINTDGHGTALLLTWTQWSQLVFNTVFNLIPFPWG